MIHSKQDKQRDFGCLKAGSTLDFTKINTGRIWGRFCSPEGDFGGVGWNLRGQLLAKLYPNGDDHAYTYDTLGRMATDTTPKNETCTYTYDLRDRQTKRDWNTTTPDTETEYFPDGSTKSIDNGATLVSYTYDTLGRMDTETQTFTGRPARTVARIPDTGASEVSLSQARSAVRSK
jgi:YD repeat-containing protein